MKTMWQKKHCSMYCCWCLGFNYGRFQYKYFISNPVATLS